MTILCLIDSLGSGGAQRQMVTLARLLNARGFHIEFVCYEKSNFYAYLLEQDGIPIHWKIADNYFWRIIRIRRFIRKRKYDAVISFLETPNFLNCIAAIGGKTWKVITSERSAKGSFLKNRRVKIFAWFQRYADHIVCNSENARQLWLKYYPEYSNKLITIYNTVLLPPITTEYIPKRDGKLHIVVAASYQYLKNVLGVIDSLNLLTKEEQKSIHIHWFGHPKVTRSNTKVYDEACKKVNTYCLNECITLNDTTTDITNKMYEADMIGLFSSVEGLPNTVCEGMSLGKPIVMTRVSDYAVLVNEANGFLCDWNSPETIKDTFITAMNLSVNELKKMGEKSKQKSNLLFSQKEFIEKWQSIM